MVAGHLLSVSHGFFNFTAFNSTDRYLMFEFSGGDLQSPLHGWAQLRVEISRLNAPDVTLVEWAYDTSGAPIPALGHGHAGAVHLCVDRASGIGAGRERNPRLADGAKTCLNC